MLYRKEREEQGACVGGCSQNTCEGCTAEIGQREKLICDAFAAEASTRPAGVFWSLGQEAELAQLSPGD